MKPTASFDALQVKKLQRMFVRIINGDYAPAPQLSPACQDLLRQLLNPEPRSRMSIADALRHPWVTQVGPYPSTRLDRC